MPDLPDDLQGAELAGALVVRERDQLQRHAIAGGRLGLPDFGHSAAPDPLDQPVSRDLLAGPERQVCGSFVTAELHGSSRTRSPIAVFARSLASVAEAANVGLDVEPVERKDLLDAGS